MEQERQRSYLKDPECDSIRDLSGKFVLDVYCFLMISITQH